MSYHELRPKLSEIVSTYSSTLLGFPNVEGIGFGLKVTEKKVTNTACIIFYVTRKVAKDKLEIKARIPSTFEGIPTDVSVGNFRAFALNERKNRLRPAKPGCSIAHYNVTAGTFGLLVKDRDTEQKLILSNNHILADDNNGIVGDPILQPGPADGGSFLDDAIATLYRYIPLKFEYMHGTRHGTVSVSTGKNIADCALAKPLDDNYVNEKIIDIGGHDGVARPEVGMKVHKVGRTTGHTIEGTIKDVNALIPVGYGPDGVAAFKHAIVIESPIDEEGNYIDFCAGGDSGSAILNEDNKLVCLLFAGNDYGGTIANNMKTVLDCLNVDPL